MKQVSPPGWKDTVTAMQKHPEITNPWALAWWMADTGKSPHQSEGENLQALAEFEKSPQKDSYLKKYGKESVTPSSLGQLQRGKKPREQELPVGDSLKATEDIIKKIVPQKMRIEVSPNRFVPLKQVELRPREAEVVMVTEGLGNLADRFYYSAQAIQSAPPVFMGTQCFLNHIYGEMKEGDVKKLCGFYRDVWAQQDMMDDGSKRWASHGIIAFDASEAGNEGLAKAQHALKYRESIPGSGREYCGLSINADGRHELKQLVIGGHPIDVNYVHEFTKSQSTDIVTLPARGGKFLRMMEDVAGSLSRLERESDTGGTMHPALKSIKEKCQAMAASEDEDEKTKLLHEVIGGLDALGGDEPEPEPEPEPESEDETEDETEAEKALRAAGKQDEAEKVKQARTHSESEKKIRSLESENKTLKAEKTIRNAKALIDLKMKESGLPVGAVSAVELLGLTSDEIDTLIRDRKAFIESVYGGPVSKILMSTPVTGKNADLLGENLIGA